MALAEPFHRTDEEATKFVPVRVSAKPELPAFVDVDDMEVSVGTGLLIVNVCAFDIPPPGVGFTTVMDAVPAVAISPAVIVAVSVVEETKVVARAEPLKSTVDEALKLVPLTVSMNCTPPAVVEAGKRILSSERD